MDGKRWTGQTGGKLKMKAIIVKENELNAKRDALLTFLENEESKGKFNYRLVHYYVHTFVDALKEDEPFHPQKI